MIQYKAGATESLSTTEDRKMPPTNKWSCVAEDATPLMDSPDAMEATVTTEAAALISSSNVASFSTNLYVETKLLQLLDGVQSPHFLYAKVS